MRYIDSRRHLPRCSLTTQQTTQSRKTQTTRTPAQKSTPTTPQLLLNCPGHLVIPS
jgi:hypothetical protein